MEHSRLLARLLSEVATARAAITESYSRLWRSETGPPGDPGGDERGLPRQGPALGSMRDERDSDDVG
jgi:hypothetical protein